jgi:hypothetical protein
MTRPRQMVDEPKRASGDIKASFLGSLVLLGLACWGVVSLIRSGDAIHKTPVWLGNGSYALGFTIVFIMAMFGVALLWRGIDKWRGLRKRTRR